MDKISFDFTQLENWDFVQQPPVSRGKGPATRILPSLEVDMLKLAVRLGKAFSPGLGTLEELLDTAGKPVTASVKAPAAGIGSKIVSAAGRLASGIAATKFSVSKSRNLTIGVGTTWSASAIIGGIFSAGVYGSTTGEIGCFDTLGGGVFFSYPPSASMVGEVTFILGTPLDFAGPYFGVAISVAPGLVTGGGTVLFSPKMPLTFPLDLTLMGVSVNYGGCTPTKLPISIALEVTNTQISGIKVF